MPSEEHITIDLHTPSSIADREKTNNKTKKKNAQKQGAFQTFEFVSSQDAHRARSCAMRQSWRKRKQQQKLEQKEHEPSERRARPLVAKPDLATWVSLPNHTVSWPHNDTAVGTDIAVNAAGGDLQFSTQDLLPGNAGLEELLDLEAEIFDFSNLELPGESLTNMDNVLSPLALDPFDTFPIHLTTRHHELLHHCKIQDCYFSVRSYSN
jgi:hypothetical protein